MTFGTRDVLRILKLTTVVDFSPTLLFTYLLLITSLIIYDSLLFYKIWTRGGSRSKLFRAGGWWIYWISDGVKLNQIDIVCGASFSDLGNTDEAENEVDRNFSRSGGFLSAEPNQIEMLAALLSLNWTVHMPLQLNLNKFNVIYTNTINMPICTNLYRIRLWSKAKKCAKFRLDRIRISTLIDRQRWRRV